MACACWAQQLTGEEALRQLSQVKTRNYSRVYPFHEGLACVVKDGLRGFVDRTGREVIAPTFLPGPDDARFYDLPFSSGRARVFKDNKYGFIDREGRQVVDYRYDYADPFVDGRARVYRDSLWGWIDTEGREVVPCQYKGSRYSNFDGTSHMRDIEMSHDWMVVRKDGKTGIRRTGTGQEVIPCDYERISHFDGSTAFLSNNGKWGVWADGRVTAPCIYDLRQHDYFSDHDFTRPLLEVQRDGKYGYLDRLGHEVVPCQYDGLAVWFDDGLLVASKDNRDGVIDSTGKVVVPFEYDMIYTYSLGRAMVVKGNKYGYIDREGHVAIPITRPYNPTLLYTNLPFMADGKAMVFKGGMVGLIDEQGRQAVPCIYKDLSIVLTDENDFVIVAVKNNRQGLITTTGKQLTPFVYEQVGSKFSDGLLRAQKGRKTVYLDAAGHEVLVFDGDADDFYNGLAIVYNHEDKKGLIDREGRQVALCQYDDIKPVYAGNKDSRRTGLMITVKDGKVGLLNAKGAEVLPCTYDKIETFHDDYIETIVDKMHGAVSLDGKVLLPAIYKYGSFRNYNYREGMKSVTDKDGKVGFINQDWKLVVPCQYEDYNVFNEGLAPVKRNGQWGFINSNGQCSLDY